MGLATDLACALDPVVLAQQAGITPDPWQADVLRSTAPRMLLNCSRQSGKSSTVAIMAVHEAIYAPGALVLLLSPSLRQSSELYKKCAGVYQALGRPVAPHSASALQLELENGSRIVSLPGKEGTIRGYSGVRLLCIDEASRVEDPLYMALRPMLSVSQGRLIALSTPFGTRGWFYESWRGQEPWERYEVPATSCPRISAEFLAEEKRSMGPWWYRQEYECLFSESQAQVFRLEDVERCINPEVEVWAL